MTTPRADEPSFQLPPSLDLGAAEALLQTMRDVIQEGGSIDGALVERVSTPCLQVLAAGAAAARHAGLAFRIVAPSPVLLAAIADLDLAAAIPVEA
jgi:chemotaxis protein CheX